MANGVAVYGWADCCSAGVSPAAVFRRSQSGATGKLIYQYFSIFYEVRQMFVESNELAKK
jgi:hypothetical protein